MSDDEYIFVDKDESEDSEYLLFPIIEEKSLIDSKYIDNVSETIFFKTDEYIEKNFESYNYNLDNIIEQYYKDYDRHTVYFNGSHMSIGNFLQYIKKYAKYKNNKLTQINLENLLMLLVTQSSYFFSYLYATKIKFPYKLYILNTDADKYVKFTLSIKNEISFKTNIIFNAVDLATEKIMYKIRLELLLNIQLHNNLYTVDPLGILNYKISEY